ncbi:hypothetical protein [Actinokineospora iranica]|uniref:Uncharacterized protein n=1 Tax=Actinokineospora iranica TaxID=1271860 RepID=A0A1G6X3M6_9PSEU|nr:hypothetical protein [Actinokineospora iranica]SDD72523.1 hypothetical protein SAMN05216174_11683 [Actinokineospora iranica]
MPHDTIAQADALSCFPELNDLPANGNRWGFHSLSEPGAVFGVAASRAHPDYTDAVFVFEHRHVLGIRVAPGRGGGIVWMRHGDGIAEIARELVEVPAPGEPGAPGSILPVDALIGDYTILDR